MQRIQRLLPLVLILLLAAGGVAYAYHAETAPRHAALRAHPAPRHRTPSTTDGPSPTHPAASTATPTALQPTATAQASATLLPTETQAPTAVATWTPSAQPTQTTQTQAQMALPTATATRQPRPAASTTSTPSPSTPSTPSPTPGVPLQLGAAQFSLFTVNPQFTKQYVSFTLSAAAHVQVRIAPPGAVSHVRTMDLGVQPAGTVEIIWDGRDNAHRLVPEGPYTYTITATGRGTDAGRGKDVKRQSESYDMLGITYKRIVVSLSQQRLWAYDGTQYVLNTLVSTGNAALPTPLGQYPILARYSPFTMVSPWPAGSQFYYAPSPVNYALLFDNRGYYVHDAPWRSSYGPGSNATVGTPGQDYTGTHGCVNVPLVTMRQLFAWATIGTVVDVVP